MGRKPRDNVAGGIYHVYARGNNRALVFFDDRDRRAYLGILGDVLAEFRWCDWGTASKITFIERGDGVWDEIGTATEGKGTIPFEPGLAAEGEREIIAQYDVNGIPGPIEELDVYDAPPPPEAGEASNVKVKREGKKLTIKWGKVAEATDYGVVVQQLNGVQKSKIVPAKKRTLKVGRIDPTEAGTVAVSGIGPLGDIGTEDIATFKAIKKKPDRRIPYDQLGEGGPKL